jgi:protein-S-isoprenylcysteine O-methyltransferase Ste14
MVLNSSITVGFSLLLLAELLEIRGTRASRTIRGLGYLFVVIALLLFVYPVAGAAVQIPARRDIASEAGAGAVAFLTGRPVLFYLLLAFSLISAAMLIWTVFLELALGKKKFKLRSREVFSRGSYGICRHPGFWWLAFHLLPLGIIRGLVPSIFSMLLMVFFNFVLVMVQDQYSFPRFFKDYEAYRKKVPFLIPRFIKKGFRLQ